LIEFPEPFDPEDFNLKDYIEALKGKFDADAAADATVKAWQVIIGYAVPDDVLNGQLKTAISTAMGVLRNSLRF